MLPWEIANLLEYLIIVNSCGCHARSSLVLYCRHFRVIVVVDGSIRMVMVMVVMVVRNGVCCVAGHACWRAVLSIFAVMMMAGRVSWFL